MPLDPQVQSLLNAMTAQGMQPFDQMTVPQAREAAFAFISLEGEPEDVAEVRTVTVPDTEVTVLVSRPDAAGPLPLVVYFHGGGWLIGNCEVADRPCRAC